MNFKIGYLLSDNEQRPAKIRSQDRQILTLLTRNHIHSIYTSKTIGEDVNECEKIQYVQFLACKTWCYDHNCPVALNMESMGNKLFATARALRDPLFSVELPPLCGLIRALTLGFAFSSSHPASEMQVPGERVVRMVRGEALPWMSPEEKRSCLVLSMIEDSCS